MPSLLIKRGTRAQLEAAKAANGLAAGELYLITDESRIAVGTANNSYSDFFTTANLKDTNQLTYNEANNTLVVSGDGVGAARERIRMINTNTSTNSACYFTILSGSSPDNYLQIVQYATEYSGNLSGKSSIQSIGSNLILRSVTANSDIEFMPGGSTTKMIFKASGNVLINETSDNTINKLQVTGSGYFSSGLNVPTGQTYSINNVDAVTPGLISARLNSTPINYITGRYYDQATRCTASATIAGAAGRLEVSPFTVAAAFSIDRLGVNVTTLIASALGRCVVYTSDSLGQPSTRVLYGSSDLDFSTTGLKEHTVSYTFQPGVLYWVGIHHSSTATISAIPVAGLHNLGLSSGTATNYQTCLRQTVTYATGAPATWTFAASQLSSNVIFPSIRFRAA